MKRINLLLFASSILFFTACGSNSPKEDEPTDTAPVERATEMVCTYGFDAASTKITWTAFKTSSRVAVGGGFDEFLIDGTASSSSESAVFENASFTIPTASVNSSNPDRDMKIGEFFFGPMVGADTISGGIKKISEAADNKGAAILTITMNGVSKDVNATYTLFGTELTMKASINVLNWSADASIAALNEACDLLHTGEDGTSKLWSEVDIQVYTNLTKDCK